MTPRAVKNLKVGRAYTNRTARFSVPVLFWATGSLGIMAGLWRLWVVRGLLLRGSVGQGPVIASVHLFTLAGFTMLMMGALYQLVPVLLNCEPVPMRYSVAQWAIYTIGITLFVFGVNGHWMMELGLGGSGILTGVAFFLANLAGRIRQRTTWNITAWFFVAALGYLALTLVMGGLLVLRASTGNPTFANELPVHLTIALGGWFGLLVMGASYRLWAMFGRQHHEPRYWRWTWLATNLAVWVLVVGYLGAVWWLTAVGWSCQLGAFVFYGADIAAGGLFDRPTMKDPALRTLVPSLGFLVVWEALGSWAMFGHERSLWIPALLAYGLGWVGMSFLGFVQKILPFIVWLHRYAHVHGRGKMPRLEDIWRPSWAYGPMVACALGLGALLSADWLKSNVVFTAGVILQIVAWLLLLSRGVRAIRGPHRMPR